VSRNVEGCVELTKTLSFANKL